MRGNFVLTEKEVATLKRVPENVSKSAIIRRLINALEALLNESGEASLGYIMSGNIELLLKEDFDGDANRAGHTKPERDIMASLSKP